MGLLLVIAFGALLLYAGIWLSAHLAGEGRPKEGTQEAETLKTE